MKIAASQSVLTTHPDLLAIPPEPGSVDITVILRSDWLPSYSGRSRQLRYIIVESLHDADQLLEKLQYDVREDDPPDR